MTETTIEKVDGWHSENWEILGRKGGEMKIDVEVCHEKFAKYGRITRSIFFT